MRMAKHQKATRWGIWTIALAGLGSEALLGNTPMVLASPECYKKVECAQLPVPTQTCSDLCNKLSYCGNIKLFVGLGFMVEEADHDGYEDVTVSGAEFCYRQQPCKNEKVVECDEDDEEWKCENDGDPEDIYAHAEGFLGNSC